MSHALIRPANPTDAVELARLASLLGYPTDATVMQLRLNRLLSSDRDVVLVAAAGNGMLQGWIHGFLSQLLESDYRVEIGGLIVDAPARRAGVGRQLVQALEHWAQEHEATEISVRCRAERPEAHIFYHRLGFTHTKTQKVFRKRQA